MKNQFIVILLLLGSHMAQAQFFNYGVKGGINTQIDNPNYIVVVSGGSPFKLFIDNFTFGAQFGIFFRFGKRIYVQPELVFNSNHTNYKFDDSNLGKTLYKEKYQYLDMPVLVGMKLGRVRIQGGPVGHLFLHSKSELIDIKGYKAKYKEMKWGYQTGIGFGKGKFSFDVRYEGNFFSKTGDHITFFGDKYSFSTTPARIILGLSFALKN
jgi:hypothetical protein